ncbi:hypothetical protein [Lelliottia aquatilis]|uniref:hypothetical protein n=1 Tax=Lelliottia aquatilis TaxID=2080838 RepID=UPI000CDE7DCD|nr:hypothetical protein [Lelliottia aquatilis]
MALTESTDSVLFITQNNHMAGQKLQIERQHMNHELYPTYTLLTNDLLANALSLECMFKAYIDDQDTSVIESAFIIANTQLTIVRNLRDMSEGELDHDIIHLSARSVGVSLMVSALMSSMENEEETEEKTDNSAELPEAILTMVKGCISNLKSIRYSVTSC